MVENDLPYLVLFLRDLLYHYVLLATKIVSNTEATIIGCGS